jgi:hypothetical protein
MCGEDAALVGGACLCENYELRVTQRCLTEDLSYSADATFSEALAHDIVRAFRRERSAAPVGSGTVGPAAGANTLHRLRHTDDHRGATWFDEEHGVVWLCAYGFHRSGEPDDAFHHFHRLIDEERIRPEVGDYVALLTDREQRFAEIVRAGAPGLLEEARHEPEQAVTVTLGGVDMSVVIVVVETLQETYVAIAGQSGVVNRRRTLMILSAFYPEAEIGEWSVRYELPTRALDAARLEVCWSILHGVA